MTAEIAEHQRLVTLKIRRFDPEESADAYWQSFEVPVERGDRLLDALHHVKWYLDGSLTFRRSCAHGVCGSDAMRVNGVNRLACKVLVKDLGDEITVEPIKGLPTMKDLVVDMEPFFEAFRSIKPFLITTGNEPTRERLQSAADRERFDDTNFMRHTMAYKEGEGLTADVRLDYKPVTFTRYEPMERKY